MTSSRPLQDDKEHIKHVNLINNTEESNAEYAAAKCQVKRSLKQAKRSKETNIATICKSNPKFFYSYINERRIVRDIVGPLKTPDGIVVTTCNDMANTLNDYFSSVFTQNN